MCSRKITRKLVENYMPIAQSPYCNCFVKIKIKQPQVASTTESDITLFMRSCKSFQDYGKERSTRHSSSNVQIKCSFAMIAHLQLISPFLMLQLSQVPRKNEQSVY
ncbi:hypothetical protein CEXT_389431 [Caerostris extrusa]|uniref:Uncharacterized protein n=1 Tax=Caerostris extrusa TaxID=172846 RepID=A0AAV4MNU5_CAEEX|nr:hypothetical protein CEXT_389431 [Caerostris extrusa]